MMSGQRHVQYTSKGWRHTQGLFEKSSRIFDTREEAAKDAQRIASANGERLVIHDKNMEQTRETRRDV